MIRSESRDVVKAIENAFQDQWYRILCLYKEVSLIQRCAVWPTEFQVPRCSKYQRPIQLQFCVSETWHKLLPDNCDTFWGQMLSLLASKFHKQYLSDFKKRKSQQVFFPKHKVVWFFCVCCENFVELSIPSCLGSFLCKTGWEGGEIHFFSKLQSHGDFWWNLTTHLVCFDCRNQLVVFLA